MAATVGNQWWRLRAKSGRGMLYTPDTLWEAACEYFDATDARKWIKKDWVGKDAEQVNRENETPYTITGLCLFLDVDDELTNEEEALEYGVTAYLLRKNTDFLVCTHPYVGDLTYEYVTHWTILNDPEQ